MAWDVIDNITGPAGADGAAGLRGMRRFHGDGPPGTVAGSIAWDEYRDDLTGDIYQRVTSDEEEPYVPPETGFGAGAFGTGLFGEDPEPDPEPDPDLGYGQGVFGSAQFGL